MSKILFFLRYFRDKASSRVRGFYLAEELCKKKNIYVNMLWGRGKSVYLKLLQGLIKQDVIYFQKQYSAVDIQMNRLARLFGKKTIFDLDDAPFGLYCNKRASQQAVKMMKIASAVTVGSQKLKDFALKYNEHTYIVPSLINLPYYKPQRNNEKKDVVTLGWLGDGVGYKHDLLVLKNPIMRLAEHFSFRFIIIGALQQKEIYTAFGSMEKVDLKIIDEIDWKHPLAAACAIQNFDVGLYPLRNNDYNQYKCGFKALEYMAMEIPVVASPVGQTKSIIEHGRDGFLVYDTNQWYESLKILVENEDLRRQMGRSGRKKVEKFYSQEVCTEMFLRVLKDLNAR